MERTFDEARRVASAEAAGGAGGATEGVLDGEAAALVVLKIVETDSLGGCLGGFELDVAESVRARQHVL